MRKMHQLQELEKHKHSHHQNVVALATFLELVQRVLWQFLGRRLLASILELGNELLMQRQLLENPTNVDTDKAVHLL